MPFIASNVHGWKKIATGALRSLTLVAVGKCLAKILLDKKSQRMLMYLQHGPILSKEEFQKSLVILLCYFDANAFSEK